MRRVALIALLVAPYLLWAVCVMDGAGTHGKTVVAPPRLSETGLYDSSGAIDPRNFPFIPQYPLWSDGAEKVRWVRLPAGEKIDISDIDAWRFPAGTKFWKQFSWGGRKVETRMPQRSRPARSTGPRVASRFGRRQQRAGARARDGRQCLGALCDAGNPGGQFAHCRARCTGAQRTPLSDAISAAFLSDATTGHSDRGRRSGGIGKEMDRKPQGEIALSTALMRARKEIYSELHLLS